MKEQPLKHFHTNLEWKDCLNSEIIRGRAFCPNCGCLTQGKETMPNGNGVYICRVCEQPFLVWFEDMGMSTLVPKETLTWRTWVGLLAMTFFTFSAIIIRGLLS